MGSPALPAARKLQMANVQRERELTRWMISSLATRGSELA